MPTLQQTIDTGKSYMADNVADLAQVDLFGLKRCADSNWGRELFRMMAIKGLQDCCNDGFGAECECSILGTWITFERCVSPDGDLYECQQTTDPLGFGTVVFNSDGTATVTPSGGSDPPFTVTWVWIDQANGIMEIQKEGQEAQEITITFETSDCSKIKVELFSADDGEWHRIYMENENPQTENCNENTMRPETLKCYQSVILVK